MVSRSGDMNGYGEWGGGGRCRMGDDEKATGYERTEFRMSCCIRRGDGIRDGVIALNQGERWLPFPARERHSPDSLTERERERTSAFPSIHRKPSPHQGTPPLPVSFTSRTTTKKKRRGEDEIRTRALKEHVLSRHTR